MCVWRVILINILVLQLDPPKQKFLAPPLLTKQANVLGLNQLNSYDMTLFRIICLSFSSIQMIYFELFDFKML